MAKKIPCTLTLHGSSREIPMGQHESKAAARRYVDETGWERPYSVKPVVSNK